ncbi:MAG: aminotransferase class I/II-fold pyridoxal phosphate-dependent enzyme [bacterium]|nr:aminotransferase class I/II-fold pyridoxal phosphate-dependent enzyme [bacterium]
MDSIRQFENALAARVFPDGHGEAIAFWKGRVALYAILKALGIKPGDEVILPAYTCVVVPNAIIYCGAKPVYVDINPRTWTLDTGRIEAHITPHTRAIIAQNTFGLSADLDLVVDIAAKHHLHVVEDCAHGLGGTYKGRPNGSTGSASFVSFQWNKTITTGLGGMAFASSETTVRLLRDLQDQAASVPRRVQAQLRAQQVAHSLLSKPRMYWAIMQSYRSLSRLGLAVGSSSAIETESPSLPPDYFRQICSVQSKLGLRAIEDLSRQLTHRIAVARQYRQCLLSLGVEPCYEPDNASHSYLRFPLLVSDRRAFMSAAQRRGIEIGDWLNSPLHPVQSNLERWGYVPGSAPIAERTAARMVNLPTHSRTDGNVLRRNIAFLRENVGLIRERQDSGGS